MGGVEDIKGNPAKALELGGVRLRIKVDVTLLSADSFHF